MENVRIIVTGGTIDKVHDTQTEGLSFAPGGVSHLPDMLKTGRCYFPIVEELMFKDSLEFSDDDRKAILEAAARAPEAKIVITHGTGTMDKTARYLEGNIPRKTIVLTGAMRPFSLSSSDGEFNLGGAIIAAQLLEAGIWAVMNGRIFPADKILKNTELGRFDV